MGPALKILTSFLSQILTGFFSLHLHSLYNFLSTIFKRFQDISL
jgi:hypothetical protein